MSDERRIERRAAVAELLRERNDLLVVSGLGSPTWDLMAAGDHDLNCYLWGAMGAAATIGLGLALAQRERPVLVITGDGEMLMGLGALATIGVRKPPNLAIAVIDNEHYGETGMQRSHTAGGLRLDALARDCGFDRSDEIRDVDALASFRERIHAKAGTSFAAIKVEAGDPPRVLAPRDGIYVKHRFRAALGLASA